MKNSAIFGIYFLEKGSNSTFLAFFPNKEISKEPEEGEQEITKKC